MLLDFFTSLLSAYLILIAIWLITLIIVFVKLFARDISLPEKILWAIIIFIAPVIGLIFYLILALQKNKKLLDANKKSN